LEGALISAEGLEEFGGITAEDVRELEQAGLVNRLDVRRSLAEYAVAEASLELEIAKQYPDLHIGPGYQFDQGQNKWELGLSLTLPILNQNGGAIAEARARRDEQGVKFLGVQAQAIAGMEGAIAAFESAIAELAEADAQIVTLQKERESAQRLFDAGEQDRLTLTGMQVQYEVATRLRLDAIRKAGLARGAIEDAIQRPLNRVARKSATSEPASRGAGKELVP
jgi:cobalt-zinc-cadmium efflux system outer membrane protein